MKRMYTKDVPRKAGEKVKVAGWVRSIRDLGRLKFIILADREGKIQITARKEECDETLMDILDHLTKESVIVVEGRIELNKQAPGGREILPEKVTLLSKAERIPLDVTGRTKADLSTRLDQRVLDLRRPENLAIFKIQSKLVEGMERWLDSNGYLKTFTPCIMANASEGGAEVFPVIYYEREAFLRQDPQLHRQLLMAAGFEKIYDLGPSWRAEKSHTIRHLSEHRGCAVELSFIKDETDTMRVEEEIVISAIKAVKKECKEELELLGKDVKVPKKPFPELRFPKVYDILKKLGKEVEYGGDIDRESETLLWKYVQKKYKSDFFFLNRFPFDIKPFYVMRVDEEPQWARSVDLVFKGIELSSGGQREHRYEKIIHQAKAKNLNLENLKWFTEHFRYGAPPHGGFNLGIERLTMQLLDIPNIREAVLFPRTPERLLP
ncbi:MAG: aspartate--tRNA(Asn) ligase [Candidatus Aenigmatarchaeota archaeon]|nr:MAG: aspartate--tRNA(Asn) ligase [Candidatus Aenigmarchaeota archaeon]